ncbi:MAG: hypothetical protein Q9219_006868 [cf. Caloplaca sp. 3 TL-2023]
MSHSSSQPHAAYIEDYNEDAHTTVPESRQTANVAAKRSRPEISMAKVSDLGRDEASDSGYSSHTVATLNSGNSSLGSKAGSATLTLDTSLESLAANKRRPAATKAQSQTLPPHSPHKPSLRRSDSKARQKEATQQGSCKCEECQAKAKHTASRPTTSPHEPSSVGNGQRKQRPSGNSGHLPASKNVQISAPPAPPAAATAPLMQPAQPRPRHSGSQAYRTRQPMTYSAPPIVEYPQPPQYNGVANNTVHRTFSERDRERAVPLREEYFPFDEDYYRMPPPPAPPPKPPSSTYQRPGIRHAATASARASHPELYFADEHMEEEQMQRSPHKAANENYDRAARPTLATRQSNQRSGDKVHRMDRLEHSFAQMSVEGSGAAAKQRRRMTFYGGPISKDLEREAEAYQADKAANAEAATMVPLTADSLRLVRHKTQTSNSDAGSRASGEGRASRDGSDVKARSVTGRRGSSEVKTRNDDGFTMRFNTSQGVNLDLKGGAKDRTISLRQSREGEGNMELSIRGKTEAREKSRRRQSYIDGTTVRELESLRTASRMGRSLHEADGERPKDRSIAASQSRRSSRNRRALME